MEKYSQTKSRSRSFFSSKITPTLLTVLILLLLSGTYAILYWIGFNAGQSQECTNIEHLEYTLPPIYTSDIQCTLTAYTNRKCETNSDNNHTAIMEKPIPGKTCAVSRDLMHWLGGTIYIPGIGIRRVNDLMHARHTQCVDICMGTVKEATKFGKQENKNVIFLGR